jgi:hypothetical protein
MGGSSQLRHHESRRVETAHRTVTRLSWKAAHNQGCSATTQVPTGNALLPVRYVLVSGRIPLEAIPTVDKDFIMALSNVVARLLPAFYW